MLQSPGMLPTLRAGWWWADWTQGVACLCSRGYGRNQIGHDDRSRKVLAGVWHDLLHHGPVSDMQVHVIWLRDGDAAWSAGSSALQPVGHAAGITSAQIGPAISQTAWQHQEPCRLLSACKQHATSCNEKLGNSLQAVACLRHPPTYGLIHAASKVACGMRGQS